MNKEDSGPRAWFSRFCPKDLDLFADILVVLQECSLNNPAISVTKESRQNNLSVSLFIVL
jgi:hypothetical protein